MQSTTIHFHLRSPAGDIQHTTKVLDDDDLEQIFMLSDGLSALILIAVILTAPFIIHRNHPLHPIALHIPVRRLHNGNCILPWCKWMNIESYKCNMQFNNSRYAWGNKLLGLHSDYCPSISTVQWEQADITLARIMKVIDCETKREGLGRRFHQFQTERGNARLSLHHANSVGLKGKKSHAI